MDQDELSMWQAQISAISAVMAEIEAEDEAEEETEEE